MKLLVKRLCGQYMTGRKTRALEVPPVVPYKALEKFSKALYGTTGGTYSARIFRPVMRRCFDARKILIHLKQLKAYFAVGLYCVEDDIHGFTPDLNVACNYNGWFRYTDI